MTYVEEREFTLRFELRCTFADDYQGEEDGYEWAKAWPAVAARIVQSAAAVLSSQPGWKVRGGNRGRSSDEEVTLVVEREGR